MAGGERVGDTQSPVTLNLFQGPFRVMCDALCRNQWRGRRRLPPAPGRAAPWMLERSDGLPVKQVQHDHGLLGRGAR